MYILYWSRHRPGESPSAALSIITCENLPGFMTCASTTEKKIFPSRRPPHQRGHVPHNEGQVAWTWATHIDTRPRNVRAAGPQHKPVTTRARASRISPRDPTRPTANTITKHISLVTFLHTREHVSNMFRSNRSHSPRAPPSPPLLAASLQHTPRAGPTLSAPSSRAC